MNHRLERARLIQPHDITQKEQKTVGALALVAGGRGEEHPSGGTWNTWTPRNAEAVSSLALVDEALTAHRLGYEKRTQELASYVAALRDPEKAARDEEYLLMFSWK